MDITRSYEIENFKMISFIGEISEELKSIIIGSTHENHLLTIFFRLEPTVDQENALVDFLQNHDPNAYADYRIMDLIASDFKTYPIGNVDFSRHLRNDVVLEKKVNLLENGRPEKAKYFHNEVLVAEIQFVFETTPSNLMTKRTEILYYYRDNNTKSDPIVLKSKTYDLTDPYEGAIVLKERINARINIVEKLKAFLSGVIMQATGQDIVAVIALIKPFWDECKVQREDFIELGIHDWSNYLNNIDLNSTPYSFLAIPISAPAEPIYDEDGEITNEEDVNKPLITVRDYLVDKITY